MKDYKFLIVDRNSTMRSIIRHQLTLMECKNISESGNAESALLMMGRHDFDIILTELDLPGMGGIEFVEYIRQKMLSSVPILVISADNNKEHLIQVAQAGATGFLIKPFTPVAFEQHIRNLLRHN